MKKILLFSVFIFTFFIFSSNLNRALGSNPCSSLGYECGSVYSKGDKQTYNCGTCTPATTKTCDVVTHKCIALDASCGTCQTKGYNCGNYKNSCDVTQDCGSCSGTDYCSSVDGGTCKTSGGGGGSGTGDWGDPGSGPSLYSISNLLGSGAPNNAPRSGYEALIKLFLNILIIAAIILSLLYLIWGGFDWMTSGGDKQKLQGVRHKITFAIIGLAVVFLAFFIINIINNFFGIR